MRDVKTWLVATLFAGLGAAPAMAALVTLSGTHVDVTYDDTQLGLFGTPTLVGDSLFLSVNQLQVESLNGSGSAMISTSLAGLVFSPKGGWRLSAFDLASFGDYVLNGAGSAVQVEGSLSAFNVASAATTLTQALLQVDPLTPLDVADGNNQNWTATARLDGSTAAAGTNVFGSQPSAVGLRLDSRLTATTAAGNGFRQAFVEQKFSGLRIDVRADSATVPLPATLPLVGLGLWLVARTSRRCATSASHAPN